MLNRYGAEIEADLAFKTGGSLDPRTMWRRREWRKLLNLIDHLPTDSFTRQAMANDDEHTKAVAAYIEKNGQPEDVGPPASDWSPEVEMTAQVADAIVVLTHTLMAANGAKPPKFKPVRRPNSPSERAAHLARMAGHQSLVDRVNAATAAPQDPDAASEASSQVKR